MKLDDFDSVFRSSVKERFQFAAPRLESILLLTDLGRDDADGLEATVRKYLAGLGDQLRWRTIAEDQYSSIGDTLAIVREAQPDLIVTYRHLRRQQADLGYGLGGIAYTLTQATPVPVLLLPSPSRTNLSAQLSPPRRVMVLTSQLTGDNHLVNWAVHVCHSGGTLFFAHVEDENTYQRYVETIGMIPDLDTDSTARKIADKLLDRPADYIASITEVLRGEGVGEEVVPLVVMGHPLRDYQRLVEQNEIDLLVLNSKDDEQLAMSSIAYAIAVELKDHPVILL